jgi:signal transduction histidine kinase
VPARAWLRACLPADAESSCVEGVIAVARTFLSATALVAAAVDPTEPAAYADLVRRLLVGYTAFGAAVFLILRVRRSPLRALPLVTHVGDVCFAALLTLFTAGPNSPFFMFLVFGLLTAAYRWGFRGTLATVVVTLGWLGVQVLLLSSPPGLTTGVLQGEFDLNRLIMRASYLGITGLLLAYLADHESERRREASSIATIMRKVRVRAGVKGTTEGVYGEVLALFRATRAVLVVKDMATGDAYRWDSDPAHRLHGATFVPASLDSTTGEPELFAGPGDGWHALVRSPSSRHRFDVVALDADGHRTAPCECSLPASFLARYPCTSVLAVEMTLGDQWTGRTFILDPDVRGDRERAIRFAQRLAREVGPATYNVFLLHRMRGRAEAQERARLARELHDGIMQSLIASQMHVDSLRREAMTAAPCLVGGLNRVQDLLREDVLGLRDLTQRIRSLDVTPAHSLQHLSDIIERFQRETGIRARFVTNVDKASLSPSACREVALIVLEGLVNIRKHSGARHVLVRFTVADKLWTLSIEDDGRGFPFAGRRSQVELDAAHLGPSVIRERVSALGGELTLDSTPGEGARLEIAFHEARGVRA